MELSRSRTDPFKLCILDFRRSDDFSTSKGHRERKKSVVGPLQAHTVKGERVILYYYTAIVRGWEKYVCARTYREDDQRA